ncbi:MAG: carboxypeptidase regulatory-like domain-containing protein [Candidatus Neomarinimicrobiota bacterium]
MKRSTQIPALILILSSFLVVPSWQIESQGEDKEYREVHAAMLRFSKAIMGIQKALDKGHTGVIFIHAEDLKKATEEISNLNPHINLDLVDVFNENRTKVGNLTSELLYFLAEKKLAVIPHIVQDIRHACVSCHVKFRATSDEFELFPNLRNVISGEVKILKLDGEERSDRSNVVVYLDRVKSESGFPLPRKNPTISQKNRTFIPRILPVMKGTTVDFPNDDTIFHNIFSLSKTKPFDLDIYPPGELKSVTFPRIGWVKVYCNIHSKMNAHIIVVDNPFFALTDKKGLFVISGIPDGEYTLRTWHGFGKEVRTEVRVFGSEFYEYSLLIQENAKFVEHKNKFRKPYKDKYP